MYVQLTLVREGHCTHHPQIAQLSADELAPLSIAEMKEERGLSRLTHLSMCRSPAARLPSPLLSELLQLRVKLENLHTTMKIHEDDQKVYVLAINYHVNHLRKALSLQDEKVADLADASARHVARCLRAAFQTGLQYWTSKAREVQAAWDFGATWGARPLNRKGHLALTSARRRARETEQ